MKIRDYYLNRFRKEIKTISFEERSLLTNQKDFFFNKKSWLNAVNNITDNELKIFFIYSMFITIASDEIMYTYYNMDYSKFRTQTRYPKFGLCGLGTHIENPLTLIQHLIDENSIDIGLLQKHSISAAKLFVDEVDDYLQKYLTEVDLKDFFRKFVNDNDVRNMVSNNQVIKKIVDDISNTVENSLKQSN
jgi:hypothetical protein